MVKELEKEFNGRGEVRGYRFTQRAFNGYAYVYEVRGIEEGTCWWEVFERKVNTQFDCVSYPTSKAFGRWAFTSMHPTKTKELFARVTENVKNREKQLA